MRLHRHPKNRAFLDRCIAIAKANPTWSITKVEAEATIQGLDFYMRKETQREADILRN